MKDNLKTRSVKNFKKKYIFAEKKRCFAEPTARFGTLSNLEISWIFSMFLQFLLCLASTSFEIKGRMSIFCADTNNLHGLMP